jgi:hypothetical protein
MTAQNSSDGQSPLMMVFHVPEDQAYNAAYGIVMMRHAQLDYSMRMMIRTLADLSIEDALDATVRDASSKLRDIVLRLAAKRLGEGPELLTLRAMVERVKRATEKRNMLAHALVVKLRDEEIVEPQVKTQFHTFEPLPSMAELTALAGELTSLTNEINHARLRGFVAQALLKKASAKAALRQ